MPSQWFQGKFGGPKVRLLEDGTFETQGRGVITSERPYGYSPKTYKGQKPAEPGIEQWRPNIQKYAAIYKVPPQLVAGIMGVESKGQSNAVSADGGYGLMQLTWEGAKDGHSNAELISNPDLNVQLGTKLFATAWNAAKANPIHALAIYNRGRLREDKGNRWRLEMTGDYVGQVLATANWAAKNGFLAPNGKPPTTSIPKGCLTAENCPPGYRCIDGDCVKTLETIAIYGGCSLSSDCLPDEMCVNGKCVKRTTPKTAVAQAGQGSPIAMATLAAAAAWSAFKLLFSAKK